MVLYKLTVAHVYGFHKQMSTAMLTCSQYSYHKLRSRQTEFLLVYNFFLHFLKILTIFTEQIN